MKKPENKDTCFAHASFYFPVVKVNRHYFRTETGGKGVTRFNHVLTIWQWVPPSVKKPELERKRHRFCAFGRFGRVRLLSVFFDFSLIEEA